MPEYLFYAIDENGELDEYIGVGEGPNSKVAYVEVVGPSRLAGSGGKVAPEVEAVRVDETLSSLEIENGCV